MSKPQRLIPWGYCFLGLLVVVATGCPPEESDAPEELLIAKVATEAAQPSSAELGRMVEVQAFGGQEVSVQVIAGELRQLGSASRDASACLEIENEDRLSFFVHPADAEAVVDVVLREATDDDDEACSGNEIAATSLRVHREPTNVVESEDTSSGDETAGDATDESGDEA